MDIKRQIEQELGTYGMVRPYLAKGLAKLYEEMAKALRGAGEVAPQITLFETPSGKHVLWLLTVTAKDVVAAKKAVVERVDAVLKQMLGIGDEEARRLRAIVDDPEEGKIYVDLMLDEMRLLLWRSVLNGRFRRKA